MATEVNNEMATHVVGNTNPQRAKKARAFQLTLNQPDTYPKVKNYLMGLKTLTYFISCLEKAPSTGHEHIHIYTHFSNMISLSIKKLEGAHIEKCYGSPKQNIDYIKKTGEENVLDEWGEIPKQGKTIKDIKEMKKEDRENLPIQFYNIVKKINEEEANQLTLEDFEKKVKVYYIYGESGVGKTTKAKELIKEYFNENNVNTFNLVKYENNFWIGASEISEVCLYDDFRDSHMKASEFINFIDYNIHPMNVKNGSIKNKYKLIIITSVQSPEDLYKNVQEKDQEPKKQWMRRMKIIYLDNSFFD